MSLNRAFTSAVGRRVLTGSLFRTVPRTFQSGTLASRLRIQPRTLLQRPQPRRPYSTQSPNPTPNLNSPTPKPSLKDRLKKLSKEYGWTALAVYLGLSALDFPFCFLAVRFLGVERIGHAEHVVFETFWGSVGAVVPSWRDWWDQRQERLKLEKEEKRKQEAAEGQLIAMEGGDASIWTQLALAYAVHKSLIFFRVPLTAAVLPSVVKVLKQWGWKVGPKTVAKAV